MKFSFEGTNFNKTQRYLNKMIRKEIFAALESYGALGVQALQAATPQDTGLTAGSWGFEVEHDGRKKATIYWTNGRLDNEGVPVAIMLQYGHGTGTGGYVAGTDYINPATKSVFDKIADDVWKVVISE